MGAGAVPCIDPSNDKRTIVQKGLSKKNKTDFSFYERTTFYKNVRDATNSLSDISVESGFEIHQYIIVTFEINNVNGQTNDASIFNDMGVTMFLKDW